MFFFSFFAFVFLLKGGQKVLVQRNSGKWAVGDVVAGVCVGGSSLGPMVTSRALDAPRPRDCGLRQCSSAFSARLGGTGRPAGVELGTFFPPGEFSSDEAVGPEGEALLGQTLWRGSKRLLFPSPGRSMRGLAGKIW